MRRVSVLAVTLLVAVLLAACGTTYGTGSTPTTEVSATATTAPGSGGAAGNATKVTMQNLAFSPATVTIKAGDTVEWTNNDSTTHNVTGPDWESGPMAPGATFSKQFTQAGTVDYHCSIHPSMTGTITVQ